MHQRIGHSQWRSRNRLGRRIIKIMTLVAVLTLLHSAFAGGLFAQAIILADTNQYVNKQPMDSLFPWAVRPVWGINPNEFHLGGYIATHATNGSLDSVWDFADAYGLRTLELRAWLEWGGHIDTLLDAARPRTTDGWDQRVIYATAPLDRIGWAREVILYPFDSVQSYYYQCRFLEPSTRPGRDAYNEGALDNVRGKASHEKIYEIDSVSAGATIAEHLVWGHIAGLHVHRWPGESVAGDSIENHSGFYDRNDLDFPSFDKAKVFVVVTGHLFDDQTGGKGAGIDPDSILLEVDIINEIPEGTTYRVSGNTTVTAAHDTSIVYTTLHVRKSDLDPLGSPPNYNANRSIAIPVDMKGTNNGGLSGPFNDTNNAHRFDIRVRWTGEEKLALRSIALRDTMAQLLLGNDAAATTFRQQMEDSVRRILLGSTFYGPDANNPTIANPIITDRLRKLTRIYTGDEGSSTRNVGYNWVDSVLFRTYRNFDQETDFRGDDLTRGFRAIRAQSGSDATTMSSQNEQMVETHYNDYGYGSSSNPRADSAERVAANLALYGVALNQVPAIAEHNGGRFFVPELELTRDGVEDYTNLLQRYRIGAFIPGRVRWPFEHSDCLQLGRAAVIARRTGRRIINYAGVHARQYVRWLPADTIEQTWPLLDSIILAPTPIFGRITDANEIRQNVNTALCYGAQGIHYSFLGNNRTEFDCTNVANVPGTYHYNYGADWGPIGPVYSDKDVNLLTPLRLMTPSHFAHHDTITIDTCYVGWRNRMSEISWIDNTWIPGIAPTLLRLRWRDGYSIHFTETQLFGTRYPGEPNQMRERPLPTNEVVTSIRSYSRDDTLAFTRLDPPTETYVELGLFDTMTGTSGGSADPWKDTTFCYVVNRRTFERSDDILASSTRGKKMDSLAEWRRVLIRLNIPRRDTLRYTFVRVREVFPDQTHLPFSSDLRQGLDTTVANDSAVALLMRPGSGTLLEVTYLKPGDDLDGILAFNNSRKILFDGTRYFATYARFEPDSNYITSVNDNIYFRWSNPVASPEDRILWSAMEYVVSDPHVAGDTLRLENRTPSITLRTVNGDSVVTVVWSAHSINTDSAAANKRAIVARDMVVVDPDGGGAHIDEGPIQRIAYHYGSNSGLYGTPVVACLEGSEAFSWSDSAKGIGARLRKRPFVSTWWHDSGKLGVTNYFTGWSTSPKNTARFPTMPPFSRIDGNDSTIALAWQQSPAATSPPGYHDIWYIRLEHLPGTPAPFLYSNYKYTINNQPGRISHPSIDQWQCWWGGIYEGIVYEDNDPDRPGLVYRPLFSEWVPVSGGTAMKTYRWTPLIIQLADNTGETWVQGSSWPSIASLNEVIDAEAANDTTFFAVAYEDSAYDAEEPGDYFHDFRQAQIWFGNSEIRTGYPKRFQYNGYFPNTSASPVRQELHAATLYQAKPYLIGHATPTRTTRQFFGKARPTGYTARGREAMIRIDDSTSTGISLRLNDIWIASDSTAQGLAFVDRGSPSDTLDTLSQLNTVLHTGYFHAHDSTTIGCSIAARFVGDSALADTFWVDAVVELVDSANPSTGAIVIDSFWVSAALDSHVVFPEPTLDLLSGTYQIRMRLATNVPAPPTADGESVYPIGDIIMSIDAAPGAGKVRRTERSGGARARLSVQPNPAADYTEIRFSVPTAGLVAVRVIDQRGEEVAVAVAATAMETGRYAVGLDTRRMMPGIYMVELRAGKERVVEKVVITR